MIGSELKLRFEFPIRLLDIDKEQLSHAKTVIGRDAYAYKVDVTKLTRIERACERVARRFGKISILVNSDGIAGLNTTVDQYPIEEWQKIMELNTRYANVEYTTLKAVEDYQNEFRFHMPHEFQPAGRPMKTTPLTDTLAMQGAEFGVVNGWTG